MTRPATPYTPEAGTVVARVLDLFCNNPEEEYTSADLGLKFEQRRDHFPTLLASAVKHELLQYARSEGETVKSWRVGPRFAEWAAARAANALALAQRRGLAGTSPASAAAPAAAKPAGKRGGRRTLLPPLDPAQVVTRLNVKLPPPARFHRSGVSKYDFLFQGLPVDACRVVASEYHATLVTAARKRSKAGPEKFAVRRISINETGLFRTA